MPDFIGFSGENNKNMQGTETGLCVSAEVRFL